MTTAAAPVTLSIREVSELTGMTPDTLRWYEREGLLPGIDRTSDGRRRYNPAAVRFVRLVRALRQTGMPVSEVRDFVNFGPGTPNNAVLRQAILQRQENELRRRLAQLNDDLHVIQHKIADYRDMIAAGRDCEDISQ